MKSHFLTIACALSFSSLAGGIYAQSETEEGFLVKPKENYLKDVERATAAYRKSIDEARKKLLSAYEAEIKEATRKNDLDRAIALREEKEEIETAAALEKNAAPGDPVASVMGAPARAPIKRAFPRAGLIACFAFAEGKGNKVAESVSQKEYEVTEGEWVLEDGITALRFPRSRSRIGGLEIAVGSEWTIVARIRFPLALDKNWTSLCISRPSFHHLLVGNGGAVAVDSKRISRSGLNLKDLRGWHTLVAVGNGVSGRTTHYLDGKRMGEAPGVVTDPIRVIGNHSNENVQQNWDAPVEGIAFYNRALSEAEIRRIGQVSFKKPQLKTF